MAQTAASMAQGAPLHRTAAGPRIGLPVRQTRRGEVRRLRGELLFALLESTFSHKEIVMDLMKLLKSATASAACIAITLVAMSLIVIGAEMFGAGTFFVVMLATIFFVATAFFYKSF